MIQPMNPSRCVDQLTMRHISSYAAVLTRASQSVLYIAIPLIYQSSTKVSSLMHDMA